MKNFKNGLALLLIVLVASSCAQIEKATAKWKTPESQPSTVSEAPAAKAETATAVATDGKAKKKSSKKSKTKTKKKTETKAQ